MTCAFLLVRFGESRYALQKHLLRPYSQLLKSGHGVGKSKSVLSTATPFAWAASASEFFGHRYV
jgi:hypothetical protein